MKSDSELRDDVRSVLATQTNLRADAVDAQVQDGVVALTGSVESDLQRWNLRDVICGLPGVASLTDELMLEPHAPDRAPDPDVARPWFPGS